MKSKDTLGKFIAQKRKEKNLSQKDLAEKLYVTESAVSKWERGVSYPDITLVADLCSQLGITEHELVIASEDLNQRNSDKIAHKVIKARKIYLWIFNLSYITALVTCFICNIAVNHKLSWFFIVLTSCACAFSLTSLPLLIIKYKKSKVLGAFLLTLGLLLMTCCIYTGGNWFWISYMPVLYSAVLIFLPIVLHTFELPKPFNNQKTLITFIVDSILTLFLVAGSMKYSGDYGKSFSSIGLYSTLIGIGIAWLFMIVIRYIKVNGLFKTTICLLLVGAGSFFLDPVFNSIVDDIPYKVPHVDFSHFGGECLDANINAVVALSFLALAILFAAGGIVLQVKKMSNKIIK